MLEEAQRVLGAPLFVCPPENMSESDTTSMLEYCRAANFPVYELPGAFEKLESEPSIKGLVCRFPVIPAHLLSPGRFLNLHNSLLPKWRGVHPLQWALLSGDHEAGISYHLCEEKVDSGAICLQCSFPIDVEDDINRLFDQVFNLTKLNTSVAVDRWRNKQYQQPSFSTHPYAKRLDGSTQELDASLSMSQIHRIVKISQPPWPRAYLKDCKGRIEVIDATMTNELRTDNNCVQRDGVRLRFSNHDAAIRARQMLEIED